MFNDFTAPVLTEQSSNFEFLREPTRLKTETPTETVRLIADKLIVSSKTELISRPRLHELLAKSLEQYGSTLLTGRSGTGKTSIAADYARKFPGKVAWYNVEAVDVDWPVFFSYLLGSLNFAQTKSTSLTVSSDNNVFEAGRMSETLAIAFAEITAWQPLLIVLDDLHNVFDADWFAEFFNHFLRFSNADLQLLMLSRSLPPLPLWRMRSKQLLGVMDENALSFTTEETIELFEKSGFDAKVACQAQNEFYGRAAKLESLIEIMINKESNEKSDVELKIDS